VSPLEGQAHHIEYMLICLAKLYEFNIQNIIMNTTHSLLI
jgi:hypothetical protein